MVFRYKRFYLNKYTISIVSLLVLIAPFIQYYYDYEDNVYCEDKCFVKFCIKNGNKNLYFYNKEKLPLTFYPEDKVSNVKFFKKDGRYKSGYREIDFITPYSKGVKYVFKIPAYSYTCYAMEIEKEWWSDVKWSFGSLDPMLISGVQIGDKIVKELCTPIIKTWIDEIPHYKKCLTTCDINNLTCTPTEYSCIDYIEKIEHKNEQVDCIKKGEVNVSGKVYAYKDFWCKLDGNEIVCIHNKEGGEWNTCKEDGSVTCYKKNLISDKEVYYNSLKVAKVEK